MSFQKVVKIFGARASVCFLVTGFPFKKSVLLYPVGEFAFCKPTLHAIKIPKEETTEASVQQRLTTNPGQTSEIFRGGFGAWLGFV
jgi:hypothetical protein